MTERLRERRWLLEVGLVGALAVGWLVAYFGAARDLEASTPAGRRFLIELFSTDDRLVLALILGLASCLVLITRHIRPWVSLLVVSALVTIVQLRFPLLARASIVPELTVGVAAFWAASRSERPLTTVLPVPLVALVVGSIPAYEINPRLDALSGVTSGRLLASGDTLLAVFIAVLAVVGGLALHRVAAQAAVLEQQNDELDARNVELEIARQTIADRAVEGERLRIARELHDVVAHHVTTMTLHAGAARQVAISAPEQTEQALQQIEDSGREAVAELHRLLGFLRGSDLASDRSPTPSLRQLDRLAASTDDLVVTVNVEGEGTGLPPSVELSAYRIVQEALTNVRKHAGASKAEVMLCYLPEAVEVRVCDDGAAGAIDVHLGNPVAGAGLGLVGMRERVALHGGVLQAGPEPGRGWRVFAHLPYRVPPHQGDEHAEEQGEENS